MAKLGIESRLFTQRPKKLGVLGGGSVVTLPSICLPCYIRDTVSKKQRSFVDLGEKYNYKISYENLWKNLGTRSLKNRQQYTVSVT